MPMTQPSKPERSIPTPPDQRMLIEQCETPAVRTSQVAEVVHPSVVPSNDAYGDHEGRYVQEIAVRFDLHPPKTPEIARRMDEVRSWYKGLALRLNAIPASRERSLALTHLEESLYQAIAAIARSKENL